MRSEASMKSVLGEGSSTSAHGGGPPPRPSYGIGSSSEKQPLLGFVISSVYVVAHRKTLTTFAHPRMNSTCVIIGAGMTGLTAAQMLSARGLTVTLLEKSRGVGGRMATRRTDGGVFDQGAQFLTARTHSFMHMVEAWNREGLLRPWVANSAGVTTQESDLVRYVGVPSMTAVPKHLARDRHLLLHHKVLRLDRENDHWVIGCEGGATLPATAVILTPPLPQSVEILNASGLELGSGLADELRSISYNSCIALMAALVGPSAVPPPGGASLGPEPVRWIADNHQKGIHTVEGTVTVHAGPAFSDAHYRDPDEVVRSLLLDAISPYLGSPVRMTQIHRWRYSEPRSTATRAAVLAVEHPPLLIAGDSFGGPRIEGAALSGLAAADLLASLIHGVSR